MWAEQVSREGEGGGSRQRKVQRPPGLSWSQGDTVKASDTRPAFEKGLSPRENSLGLGASGSQLTISANELGLCQWVSYDSSFISVLMDLAL